MGASSALAAAVPVLWKATTATADAQSSAVTADTRSFTAGRFALEIDGVLAGFLQSFEGGSAEAEVVVEPLAAGQAAPRKHIGGVKYEDITISCGTGMSKHFYQWIHDCVQGTPTRQTGAVADYVYLKYRLNFANALLTEVGFPALDAASKDAAKMTIKFAPEFTRQATPANRPASPASTMPWLASRFLLEIDGLDCSHVSKIEALVVKQKLVDNPTGGQGGNEVEPASLEIPNLVISLPEADVSTFQAWFDDFVIKGNNGQDREKNGRLSWLSSNGKVVLGTLDLANLGIFKLEPDTDPALQGIRRVKAEMYCETMSFNFNATA